MASPPGALPAGAQVAGDCRELVCDGSGNAVSTPKPSDLPLAPPDECTSWTCSTNGPTTEPLRVGTPCSAGVCNGKGRCAACVPGTKRCGDTGLEACSSDGAWVAEACPDERPICSTAGARAGEARCVGVKDVDVGAAHACATFDDGRVRCWGANDHGQATGTGPWSDEALGLATRFQAVVLGVRHACAIDDEAQAWCWGANDFGQLGTGDYESSGEPRRVDGLSYVVALALGRDHSCARDRDGAITCWGRNDRGQLGSGTPLKKPVAPLVQAERPAEAVPPRAVAAFSDPLALRLSGDATCVRTSEGTMCHGRHDYELPPTPVAPKKGPERRAWKVRVGATSRTPRPLLLETPARGLAAGGDVSCVHDAEGKVTCWGPETGVADPSKPRRIEGVEGAVSIGLGDGFGCARTTAGPVLCWGRNDRGQLGSPTLPPPPTEGRARAVAVPIREAALALGVGDAFACVRTIERQVFCWGDARLGQVNGAPSDAPLPPTLLRW